MWTRLIIEFIILPNLLPNVYIDSASSNEMPQSIQNDMSSIDTSKHQYQRVLRESRGIRNKTLIITSIIGEPFLMWKSGSDWVQGIQGNDRFEGYIKDMADMIASKLEINYELRLSTDGKYGRKDENGVWDGMETDIAIADLTITSVRAHVVDFTQPFMNVGISLMIKKPVKTYADLFVFMNPLSSHVWKWVILSYVCVSLLLFLVTRFASEERHSGETVVESNDRKKLSFIDWVAFSVGAIVKQGCTVCPRSLTGRIVGSAWWFFTLILFSSFLVNSVTILTTERVVTPINSVQDLVNQNEVEYGLLKHSSSAAFFRESPLALYQRMWQTMASKPTVFVNSYTEGIQRVRESKGKYALLMTSYINDYTNERLPCDTMRIGRNLDSMGFGVALPKGSPLSDSVNAVILQLIENGYFIELEKKWWFDRSECTGNRKNDNELIIANVAGCIFILLGAVLLSILIALVDFGIKAKLVAKRKNISLLEGMRSYLQNRGQDIAPGAKNDNKQDLL